MRGKAFTACLVALLVSVAPLSAQKNLEKPYVAPASGGDRVACPAVAATIMCGDTIAVDTTAAANTMPSYSCGGWDESGPEQVYELTLPAGGPYDLVANISNILGGDLDVFILDSPCDSDNCLAHATTTALASGIAGGSTVYVSVDGFDGASGTADLAVSCAIPIPMTNDNCADAIVIGSDLYGGVMDTTTATADETIDPSCAAPNHNKNVWFTFTAIADGTTTVSTCGSNYDTILVAYTGACGAFTEVACNDDDCGLQSTISFGVTAGTQYWIEVSSFSTVSGTLWFSFDSGGSVPVELMSFGVK